MLFKKIVFSIVAALSFFSFNHLVGGVDYIVYKNNFQPITPVEHAIAFNAIMNYQFPRCFAQENFIKEKLVTQAELEFFCQHEREWLEREIQKKDPNLRLLTVPSLVYELFILSEFHVFDVNFVLDPKNQYAKDMILKYSKFTELLNGGLFVSHHSIASRPREFLWLPESKEVHFLVNNHFLFKMKIEPLNSVVSTANWRGAVKILFKNFHQNFMNCCEAAYNPGVTKEFWESIDFRLGRNGFKEYKEELSPENLLWLQKVAENEFKKSMNGCFVLYRGTNGVDSEGDCFLDRISKSKGRESFCCHRADLSYGFSLFSGFLNDLSACPFMCFLHTTPMEMYSCRGNSPRLFGYTLAVDKRACMNVESFESRLFNVVPFGTFESLFANGENFHPYTRPDGLTETSNLGLDDVAFEKYLQDNALVLITHSFKDWVPCFDACVLAELQKEGEYLDPSIIELKAETRTERVLNKIKH